MNCGVSADAARKGSNSNNSSRLLRIEGPMGQILATLNPAVKSLHLQLLQKRKLYIYQGLGQKRLEARRKVVEPQVGPTHPRLQEKVRILQEIKHQEKRNLPS